MAAPSALPEKEGAVRARDQTAKKGKEPPRTRNRPIQARVNHGWIARAPRSHLVHPWPPLRRTRRRPSFGPHPIPAPPPTLPCRRLTQPPPPFSLRTSPRKGP